MWQIHVVRKDKQCMHVQVAILIITSSFFLLHAAKLTCCVCSLHPVDLPKASQGSG